MIIIVKSINRKNNKCASLFSYFHSSETIAGEEVKQLNVDIKEKLGKGFCIGHSYFVFDEPCSDALLKNIVNYDILPMLAEYWFDDEEQYDMWASRLNGVFENGSK